MSYIFSLVNTNFHANADEVEKGEKVNVLAKLSSGDEDSIKGEDLSSPQSSSIPFDLRDEIIEVNDGRLQAKQDWVFTEMMNREKEYSTWDEMQIALGTWNVNGRWITEDLDDWLGIGGPEPDLVVLG